MRSRSKDWLEGYIEGLTAFAWWKDGIQYVGTCGTTLATAEKQARSEWRKARKIAPSGLAAVEASKLTTETTEKPDNNPKEV